MTPARLLSDTVRRAPPTPLWPNHSGRDAATKGAIMVFVKGLAKQLARQGIRVNGVAPGSVWTLLQVTGGQPTDRLPRFGANTPTGRSGQPAELAPLYVPLASDEPSYSTGQIFGAEGRSALRSLKPARRGAQVIACASSVPSDSGPAPSSVATT
jgi:NAD(P)-dependent dehydrogenase (short-subunit alcohol dehydrogenase family)